MSNFILNKPTESGPHPPTGVMGFSATISPKIHAELHPGMKSNLR